jgi:hypothetical protein
MVSIVRHEDTATGDDNGISSQVQPSYWNKDHVIIFSALLAMLDELAPGLEKGIRIVDGSNAETFDFSTFMRDLMGSTNSAALAAASGLFSASGGTMTGPLTLFGDPALSLQAATKRYVDNIVTGWKPKQSVRLASPAATNIDIASAPANLDGVAGVIGDRWALLTQTAPAESGIYLFNGAGVALSRADDFNAWAEIPGAQFLVEEGATRADTGWVCTVNAGGTIDVTAIVFSQFFGTGLFQPAAANLTTLAALSSIVNLSALAGLTGAADRLPYFTGLGAMALATFTAFGRSVAAAADAAAARTLLGLGTIATKDFETSISGINIITNGRFEIDQRNVGVGTVTVDNANWCDHWRYLGESSNKVYARHAGLGTAYKFCGVLEMTGTDYKSGVMQVIAQDDAQQFAGKQITASCVLAVSNARLGDIRMAMIEFTGTGNATTGDPISNWNGAGTNPTLAANWAYVNTPVNLAVTTSPVKYSVTGTPTTATNNLALLIWCDDETYNVGDLLYFTEAQIEIGATASRYEEVPFEVMYARCERRLEKSYAHLTARATVTDVNSCMNRTTGTSSHIPVRFRTPKIRIGTLTVYSPVTGSTNVHRNYSGAGDVAVTTTYGLGENGFSSESAGGVVADSRVAIHYFLDAEI